MKNTMSDEKLASKLSDDDKSTVTAKIDETTPWLDANQMAEKEEYEAKQKELEAVVNPILAALGGGAGLAWVACRAVRDSHGVTQAGARLDLFCCSRAVAGRSTPSKLAERPNFTQRQVHGLGTRPI